MYRGPPRPARTSRTASAPPRKRPTLSRCLRLLSLRTSGCCCDACDMSFTASLSKGHGVGRGSSDASRSSSATICRGEARGLCVSAESTPSAQLQKHQATAFCGRRTALRQNELSSRPPAEQPDEFDAIRGISQPGFERNHHEFGAFSANALLTGIDEPAVLRQRPPAGFERSGAGLWPHHHVTWACLK